MFVAASFAVLYSSLYKRTANEPKRAVFGTIGGLTKEVYVNHERVEIVAPRELEFKFKMRKIRKNM